MAFKDIFKVSRKTFFDPKAWLGYDSVRESTTFFWQAIKNIFVPQPVGPVKQESFDEAMERLHLTEADIQTSQRNYFNYAIIFLLLAIGAVAYGFYLLVSVLSVIGFIITLAVAILLLSQAFRFHFWYFQIKHRKLGCTFEEWRQGKTKEERSP